jgi:hypothetical protein
MTDVTYNVTNFTTKDVAACSAEIRELSEDAENMEQLSMRITRLLRERLTFGPESEPAMALVRLFKTHRLTDLPEDLQQAASGGGSEELKPETPCLTLLGTSGANPRWNQRKFSKGHQAIALKDADTVRGIPMIASLLQGFGLDIEQLLHNDPLFLEEWGHSSFNVFYIKEALGSPWIPSQDDFIVPLRIKSVLGLGGLLPGGDVFAVVMFSRVTIPDDTAAVFRSLSVTIRSALTPYSNRVFA